MSNFLLLTLRWLENQEKKQGEEGEADVVKHDVEHSAAVAAHSPSIVTPTHLETLFNFFETTRGGSEFLPAATCALEQQINELKSAVHSDDDRVMQLKKLYSYFYALYHYITEQLQQADVRGFVFSAGQLFAAQCDHELYENDWEDQMDNIRLTVQCIPEGFMIRMQTYCERAANLLFRAIPLDRISLFTRIRPIDIDAQTKLEQALLNRLHGEVVNQVTYAQVRKRSFSSAAGSPLPPILENDAPRRTEPLPQPQKQSLSFKQKWHSLSFRKKCIFGGVLAVGVIGVIAVGVLVPGSAIVTIPSVGILTAKILAVLIGSIAVAASAVAMQCHIQHHKPRGGRKDAEAHVKDILRATVFKQQRDDRDDMLNMRVAPAENPTTESVC